MTTHRLVGMPALLFGAVALPAVLPAQTRPDIVPVSAALASTTDSLGSITNVRGLPGGRLLVNDATNRRVLLLDSTLKTVAVVADSTSSTANAYGPRSGTLIPFRGDSTLFVDAASLSMLVIDPNGKIGRVMSVPRAQDAMMLTGSVFGGAAYDGVGHLVYRGSPNVQMRMGPGAPGASGAIAAPAVPDTMAIVRVDIATRKVDTVAFVKIPKTSTQVSRGDDGSMSINIEVNPLPVVDEWAMRSDGTIAVVRGRDYHVEWMTPDGVRSTSPKIAFDWKRLSDEQKAALIDSVKAQRDRMIAAAPPGQGGMAAISAAMGGAVPAGGAAPAGGAPTMRFEVRGGPPGSGPPGASAPAGAMTAPKINVSYVSPNELPDYQPPFFSNGVRADMDGRLWVQTTSTKPAPGGLVYDLIDGKGVVTQRVQLPPDRTLVGFGAGGVVFLGAREGTITRIERVTFK